MTDKRQFSVRLPPDKAKELSDYCEERDISYADALRRFVENGLDREQQNRPRVASDGGYVNRSDHPWIEPIIKFTYQTSSIGVLSLIIGVLSVFVAIPLVERFGEFGAIAWLGAFLTLTAIGVFMLIISIIGILALEYLMHPAEAPFSRFFYGTALGEKLSKQRYTS